MLSNLKVSLLPCLALALSLGCADSSDVKPHTPPSEALGTISMHALESGQAIAAASRIWYGVRPDRDSKSDALAANTAEELKDSGRGYEEGKHFLVDAEGRQWLSCAILATADADTLCQVAVPAICSAGEPCTYDFRITREALPEGITAGQGWAESPEAWLEGSFRWNDEFVPAQVYTWAYNYDFKNSEPVGPTIELSIDGDDVEARGWVRRLAEDQGVIVEILPYDENGGTVAPE